MVFLIQNAQNRDAKATHLKLDELLHAVKKARNTLIDAEELSDEKINEYKVKLIKLANTRSPKNKSKNPKK